MRFLETLRRVAVIDGDNRNRRRAIELVAEFTQAGSSAGVAALREDLERLKAENRELAERVGRMELG